MSKTADYNKVANPAIQDYRTQGNASYSGLSGDLNNYRNNLNRQFSPTGTGVADAAYTGGIEQLYDSLSKARNPESYNANMGQFDQNMGNYDQYVGGLSGNINDIYNKGSQSYDRAGATYGQGDQQLDKANQLYGRSSQMYDQSRDMFAHAGYTPQEMQAMNATTAGAAAPYAAAGTQLKNQAAITGNGAGLYGQMQSLAHQKGQDVHQALLGNRINQANARIGGEQFATGAGQQAIQSGQGAVGAGQAAITGKLNALDTGHNALASMTGATQQAQGVAGLMNTGNQMRLNKAGVDQNMLGLYGNLMSSAGNRLGIEQNNVQLGQYPGNLLGDVYKTATSGTGNILDQKNSQANKNSFLRDAAISAIGNFKGSYNINKG